MKFTRISALLLAASLSFSSCGFIIVNDISSEQAQTAETSSPNADAQDYTYTEYTKYDSSSDGRAMAEQYLSELPERDYGGAVFFITTPATEYIAPEDMESPVSKLAVERNAKVEETLGVSLVMSLTNADTMLTELKQAVSAGDYYTDLLMIPVYMIGNFRIEETLINMRSLPFFDIDQPYFNADSSAMTSGGFTTYGVAGHASISPSSYTALYMNKTVLTEAGADPDAVYSSVVAGEWTWDEYLKLNEAVRGLNETRTSGGLSAYYTFTAENTASRVPDLIFKASGNEFVTTGTRRRPLIGYTLDEVQPAMDVMKTLYNDSMSNISADGGAVTAFAEGKSAFLADYLYVMNWMTNADADWGIVPLPKQTADGDYKTLISNNELVFAVPVNHTNGEFAAITLSALNAASYGYIYDEYVNQSMLHVLRDNDSVNMLDLILDTASFDFALAFGSAYPKIANATYRLIRECAASGNLEEVYRDRMVEANKVMRQEFDLKS
ncbi:MAG: hypothetical protein IJY35_06500 [Clostridia bacterium]|nr:hypothetical protein [Clostridia bacterium]